MAAHDGGDRYSSFQEWVDMHSLTPSLLQKLLTNGVVSMDDVLLLDGDAMAAFGFILEPDEWLVFRKAVFNAKGEPWASSYGGVSCHDDTLASTSATSPLATLPQLSTPDQLSQHVKKIMHESQLLHTKSKIKEYKVNVTETARSQEVQVRKCEFGQKNSLAAEKILLLLGETGAGKSTLIDAMINHVLGVTYDHDLRFRIIDAMGEKCPCDEFTGETQTDWITCYTIHQQPGSPVGYTLHIIDTPGFGDTRGVEHDRKRVDQIRELFGSTGPHGITWIDSLCIVVKSGLNRLTPRDKYVLDNVVALFGNDIKESICAMITFGGQDSLALQALENAKVPIKYSYEFNNNWFMSNTEPLPKAFWKMSTQNFEKFFLMLEMTTSVSLRLATEVLEERKVLEKHAAGYVELIKNVAGRMSVLENTRSIIEQNDGEKEVTVIESKVNKIETKGKNRSCTTCFVTCQMGCDILQRFKYFMKNAKAICEVCEHKNKDHVVAAWSYETVQIKRVQTVKEVKDGFKKDTARAGNSVKMHLEQEESVCKQDIRNHLEKMRKCISRLDEIALRPRIMAMSEYIDMVIINENSDKRPGYEERIQILRQMGNVYNAIEETNQDPTAVLRRHLSSK